jgi:hypothetical protein
LAVKFLFMDEKYADPQLPPALRVTSLTGLLVAVENHATFRAQFYALLTKVVRDQQGTISSLTVIHAAKMFPEFGGDDARRFEFVEGLVDIVVAARARLFRVGYVWSAKMQSTFKTEKAVLGLCFDGLLRVLAGELKGNQIWPVMETDHTTQQDQTFAGFIRNLDYFTVRIDPANMSMDNKNIGEVLFSTKNSAYGTAVDFAAYLLHLRYLRKQGLTMTPFKERLADIAEPLDAIIGREEIIEMQISG